MFEIIDEKTISISLIGQINKSIEVPHLNALNTAMTVWDMCSWIYEEFVKDCKRTKNHMADAFIMRNTSRIISYCSHACLVEGIIKRLYSDTCKLLSMYVDNEILEDEGEKEKRRVEIKQIKKFRDKVAAHTVYSKPHDDDNLSDEMASISVLTSFSYSNNNVFTFSIGGLIQVHEDVKPKHDYRMGLYYWHPKLEEHFQEWEKMFIKVLEEAEKSLPIEDKEFFDSEHKAVYKLSVHRDV